MYVFMAGSLFYLFIFGGAGCLLVAAVMFFIEAIK